MRLAILIAIVSFFAASCSGTNTERRNAELVVTYNGKEVHRAGSLYATMDELNRLLDSDEEKYVIFSAPWCPPCKTMIRALEQSGHLDKVYILNLEEPWVAYLYKAANLSVVPSMLVADAQGQPENIIAGASNIIMHLLIHVDLN